MCALWAASLNKRDPFVLEIDGRSGLALRVKHHACVGRIEGRLEERAVNGLEEHFGRDALRLRVYEGLGHR